MKLPKIYEPQKYEENIYALWEKSRAFAPIHRGSRASYSIIVPPPNANGNLHLGHGLTLALEDIATRYHRMKGEATLLLPGADHAGFETQVVYEKQLAKTGKSRFDFSREELYQQIWDFVAQNRENYESQFRRLGAGVDWSRYVFTLDPKIVKRAYATFKLMWEEGLIYRGERLINFCTFHGTAFADIEVEHKEERGHLWYIKYPLVDGSGEVIVATTRPETMLGDTAVAVHPEDKKYAKFIGKTVRLPLTHREIPIVADEMVDIQFGTGAVKITPAHDPNDFEVATRHDLPKISVIDFEGKISAGAPEKYRGLEVNEARKQVVSDLEEQGFLVKTKEHTHSVGHCYKCGTVIQPLLKDQWFVDMKPLSGNAIDALKTNKIAFYPESKRQQLIRYLEGLRDWNISRQIAWGIPIPAFQNTDNPDDWIYDERVGEEELQIDGKTYRRDPDVFDTWFSSSSWPYATLDYPDGEDFHTFYPLSLMETGFDILYPWVSRMIMMGLYVVKEIPFEAVYLHGLILDERGQKMSKSKGNVVDPMQKVDQYGSDAFRMGVIAGQTPGNNQPFSDAKLIGARNFCNKLWNVARYIEDKLDDNYHAKNNPEPKTPADHWILTKLQHLTEAVSADLDNYRFSEAYDKLYHGVWDSFADWYIEASKSELNPGVLAFGLETILKLAHPFAPFVTETIWQTLAWEDDSILAVASWPEVPAAKANKAKEFEQIRNIVSEVRYLSAQLGLKKPSITYADSDVINANEGLIKQLANVGAITQEAAGKGLRLVQTDAGAWLDASKDKIAAYQDKLKEQAREQLVVIERLKGRLNNKSYVTNAPADVVTQTKEQLDEANQQLDRIKAEQQRFS
jgi:valyl-tRNA synthetase